MAIKLNFLSNKEGAATLTLVVTVMVFSLLIGLAASNRAITGIRRTSFTSQSDQAYHCAEGGAEVALAKIQKDLKNNQDPLRDPDANGSAPLTDTTGVEICRYEYSIEKFPNGNTADYDKVSQDETQEVNLDGYSGDMTVYFFNESENNEVYLELTLVKKGSSPPYSTEKHAYYCANDSKNTNFDHADGDTITFDGRSFAVCKVNFSIDNYKLARLRPIYTWSRIRVKFGSTPPPNQGYQVTSTGTAADAKREVKVVVTNPQLPSVFDFAVFSSSTTDPLKKP